jgi:hypothetical protein
LFAGSEKTVDGRRLRWHKAASWGRAPLEQPMVCEELRRRLCDTPVTLNGEPATISGVKNGFATVRYVRPSCGCYGSVEFAWEAVRRIVANGGAFRS